MKDVNYFYNIAKKENITIYKEYLGNLNGLCYANEKKCRIYINKDIIDKNVERLVLGHELGHYFKGIIPNVTFSSEYQERLKREINEYRAKKWLISEIIPCDLLKQYLIANKNELDISKDLNIPIELIKEACCLYEENLQKII